MRGHAGVAGPRRLQVLWSPRSTPTPPPRPQYIDYIGSWGPAIAGHAHPEVTAALTAQLQKGTSFGAPCELENVLAKMVIERVPSVEMVRFVNSGTEACLSVVRLMRAYTGREKASAARAACQRQSVP